MQGDRNSQQEDNFKNQIRLSYKKMFLSNNGPFEKIWTEKKYDHKG